MELLKRLNEFLVTTGPVKFWIPLALAGACPIGLVTLVGIDFFTINLHDVRIRARRARVAPA